LLAKGYEAHGIKRRDFSFATNRIDHLYQDPHQPGVRLHLHYRDLTDATNLIRIVQQVQPDEIYNLAAQSHVAASFDVPEYTANADALGVLRLLEAIRILGLEKETRFYQASTSEMFGSCVRRHSARPHRFTRVHRSVQRRFTATGSHSTTARPMVCTPAAVSFSTMSLRSAAQPSLRARLRAPSRAFTNGWRPASTWETWTRCGLGPYQGLCAGAVADAAAAATRGYCDCHRGTANDGCLNR
jgi:hypothetical protein